MAVGTSDGEYYPSHLESVLSSLDTSGSTKEPLAPRNAPVDELRNDNESPAARPVPTDVRSDVKVAQTDIRTLFPHMPEEERKAWEQSPPRELQYKYKGNSNVLDIPGTLDSKGHEDGVFVDQLHPDLLKLNQDEYDIRFVPNHEIFHIQKKTKPPLVGEADLPENARPTAAEFTPDSTWAAMVDSFTNPDSKVPSAEKMVQGNYSKVVDWLTEHGKTPGQEMQNWSTKEKLGYMISTAMGLVGPGQKGPPNLSQRASAPSVDMKLSGKDLGVSNVEPHSFNPANSNIPGLGKAHSAMTPLELMSDSEFMQQLEKSHPEINSPYERALANQKAGRMNPTGDTADVFIQALRRNEKPNLELVTQEPGWNKHSDKVHNLTDAQGRDVGSAVYREHNDSWVGSRFNPRNNQIIDRKTFRTQQEAKSFAEGNDNLNPSQEPQGRPVPSLEQRQTQEAQRAANDRNYALGKGTERVNVGPGKGVLNDSRTDVLKMIENGSKPSDIAKRFDITPLAVRNWIKTNGKMNDLKAVLDKIKDNKDQ